MSEKTSKRIRMIYGLLLSALLIVSGVLLILSCVSIFRLGDRPFTVKNISAAFEKIKLVLFITIGAVAGGIILSLLLPQGKKGARAVSNGKMTAARLWKKFDISLCDGEIAAKITREKKRRLILRIAYVIFCVVIYIPTALVALNPNNYSLAKYNVSIVSICLFLIPSTLIAIGVGIITLYLREKSFSREIERIRAAMATGAQKDTDDAPAEKALNRHFVIGARIAVFVLAIFFIIEGITNGGASDVLIKAINICTECIGLG